MVKLNLLVRAAVACLFLFVSNSISHDFDIWYGINLRVHIARSDLSQNQLEATYKDINKIWAQAGIQFKVEAVEHDDILSDGFYLWIEAEKRSYIGIYWGQHDIWTNDLPSLGSAPNPVDINVARTSAHELGHALSLNHYNDDALADQRDNVMASGTKGWELKDWQVDDTRERAPALTGGLTSQSAFMLRVGITLPRMSYTLYIFEDKFSRGFQMSILFFDVFGVPCL